jgi:hypothetical protein
MVLYGCETLSLTLREEHKTAGAEDIWTEEWRKLHNKELHDLYSIRIIKSRRMKWAGHVTQMGGGEKWNLCRLFAGNRPLGRPRHRWADNGVNT